MNLAKLVCGLFIVIGLWMSWRGIGNIRVASETNHWQQTVGIITRSEISNDSNHDGTTYEPRIDYTYTVNGIQYQGGTIYIGDRANTSDISYAQRFVSKYSINQQVSIYYKPNHPQRSVLEPGVKKATFIELAFGIISAFAGISFYIMDWLFEP